mmetsp:Transcript_36209/g.116952  ORF Transcript_36209/g.116952 Transcript_36209/m.116952 type:complete len:522 (+) Transcript_36209:55-1620(+)
MPKITEGVQFPTGPEGKRSTLATGVAVFAAAAAPAGEELAGAIRKARKTWRQEYPEMLTRLVEAQSYSAQRAIAIAEAGLAEIYSTFEFVRGGEMVGVEAAMAAPSAARALHTATVAGSGALPTSLSVPYFGDSLSDQVLVDQVNAWADYGALEPAGAAALCAVAKSAEWRDLRGRTFVALGATAELGPLALLLQCGATVVAVARGKPAKWAELVSMARASAGTLVVPLKRPASSDEEIAAAAGADLLTETPELAAWLAETLPALPKGATVGTYTYLDGELNVRISLACDLVCSSLVAKGLCAGVAFVQTPSQAFLLPAGCTEACDESYASSYLRLLRYEPNARPAAPVADGEPTRHAHDGYVPMQGPNYALAKAINHWRAVLARSRDGLTVSSNVAPACRTASMVAGDNKNARAVAAALAGMGNFRPMLVFNAETVAVLMGMLLIHDVRNPASVASPSTPLGHPLELLSAQAFHGGSFRVGVKPAALGRLFAITGFLFPSDPRPTSAGQLQRGSSAESVA